MYNTLLLLANIIIWIQNINNVDPGSANYNLQAAHGPRLQFSLPTNDVSTF
jgi:hypothetical protein